MPTPTLPRLIAELRWTVRVLSATAPDGVSVLPGSARPLYALEPLTIVLALSPVFVSSHLAISYRTLSLS